MSERIIKPRCPRCGHVQADWITQAGFTCRTCHFKFEIGLVDEIHGLLYSLVEVTDVSHLTNSEDSVTVILETKN